MFEEPKKTIPAITAGLMALASSTASADQVEYDSDQYPFEYGDNNWNYADHCSSAAGDDQLTTQSTDTPVDATQAATMNFCYDDAKNMGTALFPQFWYPDSTNHKMEVEYFSSPTDTSIRITDLQTSQQGSGSPEIDPIAEAALSYLINVASTYSGLPLPDPFDLINDEDSVTNGTNTTQHKVREFNDDPMVQGINWLTHVNTPTKTGWYMMDVHTSGDAGFRVDTAPISTEESHEFFHAADFNIYR